MFAMPTATALIPCYDLMCQEFIHHKVLCFVVITFILFCSFLIRIFIGHLTHRNRCLSVVLSCVCNTRCSLLLLLLLLLIEHLYSALSLRKMSNVLCQYINSARVTCADTHTHTLCTFSATAELLILVSLQDHLEDGN